MFDRRNEAHTPKSPLVFLGQAAITTRAAPPPGGKVAQSLTIA
jgi:hypothetical protein